MRIWLKPDVLAKLGITASDVINAVQAQNTVNPAGLIGGPPAPPGQEFTYSLQAQGRLITAEEFGNIIVRENPDGGIVHVRDVARIELGAQSYTLMGRLNGRPSAILAVYQLPGSNAVEDAKSVRALVAELKKRFPSDVDYAISLDQTKAGHRGHSRDSDHARRGAAARDRRGVPVPAGLARDAHPAARSTGLADRHLHPVSRVRIFDQHPVDVRAWCSRSAWWSTMRSSWSRRWSGTSRRVRRPSRPRSMPW